MPPKGEHKGASQLGKRKAPSEDTPQPPQDVVGPAFDVSRLVGSDKWLRPALPRIDSTKDNLSFQYWTIDQYDKDAAYQERVHGDTAPTVPVFRLYGAVEGTAGHSITVHVHGFKPYIYVRVPVADFSATDDELCKAMKDALINELETSQPDRNAEQPAWKRRRATRGDQIVLRVQMMQKKSIYGYQPPDPKTGSALRPFFKITLSLTKHVYLVRSCVRAGLLLGNKRYQFETFESNVLFPLRFSVDHLIAGCSWFTLPANKYAFAKTRTTTTQLEVHLWHTDIVVHQPTDAGWSKMAPRRVLSTDIECDAPPGHFPTAKDSPIIMIANVLQILPASDAKDQTVRYLCDVFAIGGNYHALEPPNPGWEVRVHEFKNEVDMMQGQCGYVRMCDPDIWTGYNVENFDLPFCSDRNIQLGNSLWANGYGRLIGELTVVKTKVMQSKAFGTQVNKSVNIAGRVVMDPIRIIRRDYKMRSYTLNSVSQYFLKSTKEDVHYSEISKLYRKGPEGRTKLAKYCLKDAVLPLQLIDKLKMESTQVEMARVTGVPFDYLLTKGQQIKAFSLIMRTTSVEDTLLPHRETKPEKFEGATVIEAKKNLYDVPIATLDFASLYPSLIIAYNLCYSTHVVPECRQDHKADDLTWQHTFVKKYIHEGVLPRILVSVLSARKQARKEMEATLDKFLEGVLDGRQKGLKISANSIYGFTGAQMLELRAISETVTSFGRWHIGEKKRIIEAKFTKANGYKHDAEVVYGDTDSVMIKFGNTLLSEVRLLAMEAVIDVNLTLLKPMETTFEKIYYPYLLMSAKKYAGVKWEDLNEENKRKGKKPIDIQGQTGVLLVNKGLDTKGMENVRRDNCMMISELMQAVLEIIMLQRDVPKAVALVHDQVEKLMRGQIDTSKLVISVGLAKPKYEGAMVQKLLVDKLTKRDPGNPPRTGDRLPYVIIRTHKYTKLNSIPGSSKGSQAEDPMYAIDHECVIDSQYYLEKQLKQPLLRVFSVVLKAREGDTKCAPISSSFVTKPTGRCQNTKCNVELKSQNLLWCPECRKKRIEEGTDVVSEEKRYDENWARAESILFPGEITRIVSHMTTEHSGPMMKFARKHGTCSKCRKKLCVLTIPEEKKVVTAPADKKEVKRGKKKHKKGVSTATDMEIAVPVCRDDKCGQRNLCADCEPNRKELHEQLGAAVKAQDKLNWDTWKFCVEDCTKEKLKVGADGTMDLAGTAAIACGNTECGKFYMRKTGQRKCARMHKEVELF